MFKLPFFHSEEQFQEEALRFLSLVYSVYEFDSYYVFGDPRDSFHELQWKAEREVAKSIVTLASLARVNDDYGDGLKAHQTRFPTGVGILIEDGVRKPLTSREACNKIIHATDAKWHFKHSSKHPILDSVFKKKGIQALSGESSLS